jgi:uncharacterized membrane protein YbaN (DUF454 family)
VIRLATLGVGYSFLALGVAGLFLPILQGALFIVTGLLILSREAPWARRALDWMKARHPRVATVVGGAEALAERWIGRIAGWGTALLGRPRA